MLELTPYYKDEAITIYQGDCINILPEMPQVDMILTDPPYGTQDFGQGYGRRQVHAKDGGQISATITGDLDLSVLRDAYPLMCGTVANG